MYLEQWTPYEYHVLTAFEEYYDKAIDELENMGLEGKLMLAALLRRKDLFADLYKKIEEDAILSRHYDN